MLWLAEIIKKPLDLAEIKAFRPQLQEHIKAAILAHLKTDKDKESRATTARCIPLGQHGREMVIVLFFQNPKGKI